MTGLKRPAEDEEDPWAGLQQGHPTIGVTLLLTILGRTKDETRCVTVPAGVLTKEELYLIRTSRPHQNDQGIHPGLFALLFRPSEEGSSTERVRALGLYELAGESAVHHAKHPKVDRALFRTKSDHVYSFILVYTE